MSFCPECLQKDITSSLTVVGVDQQIRICENDNCVYVEKCSSFKEEIENTFLSGNIKLELEYDIDDSEFMLSSSDSDVDALSLSKNETIDFNDYQFLTVKRHFLNLMDAPLRKPGLFNWFCLPLMLKFNSNVCFFLLIHLNLFNTRKHSTIKNLKELYYKTEDIINNIPRKLITLLGFKFSQYLYKEHQIFNLSNMKILDMSERVLRSLGNFMSSLDNGDMYRTIYSHKEKCKDCNHSMNYLKEDFAIRLMNNYRFEKNNFFYTSKCKKCLGQCDISVSIARLASFIILDLPNGTDNDFKSLMSTSISTVTGDKLQLQAIIEFQCPFPIEDVPEKVPNVNEFIFRKCVRQKIQYRIHFRNTDGWYCIDNKSGFIINSIFASDVNITLSDVRLLVYGHCNDIKEIKCNVPPCLLYNELKEYKTQPWGSVSYPRDEIKYWLHLFKFRDSNIRKPQFRRTDMVALATTITNNLNEHLERKKTRLKNKLKNKTKLLTVIANETLNDSDSDNGMLSDKEDDDNEVEEEQSSKALEEVNYADIYAQLEKQITDGDDPSNDMKLAFMSDRQDKSCFTEPFQTTSVDPISSNEKLFPLYSHYKSKTPIADHGIDQLIASKKMKMTEQKL